MPEGFTAIFFTQLFSTLSFAVLYATLALYMKQQIGYSTQVSNTVTSVYFAYNFTLHLLAGYLGGRFFSYRSLVLIGLCFQLVGCAILAIGTVNALYWGLAFMLIGTGTMVTCLNMLLTQLFTRQDTGRRESAFLWNYSSMNVGFLLGFTLAGYFQLSNNFTLLFLISALINCIAIIILLTQWRALEDRNTIWAAVDSASKISRFSFGFAFILLLTPTLYWLMHHSKISAGIILGLGGIMLLLMLALAVKHTGELRKRLLAFLTLIVSAQIFWIIYQLAPMSLTFFAKYNVDRQLFGIEIAPGWIQNINSLTIILGAPILAFVFHRMREKNRLISEPVQFGTGLLLSGMALLLLPIGIILANPLGLVAFAWIFITYVLQAIAELLIAPISYSMVGRLVPEKLQSLYMGIVMLNTGVAAVLSGFFSNFASGSTNTSPFITNPSYSHAFGILGTAAIFIALILFALTPLLHKLMQHKPAQ